MGKWGNKLYEDDIALDVKELYIDQLKRGKTNEEATEIIISENQDIILDYDDGPVFWYALADIQWSYGRLLPLVKEKAINLLKSERDLSRLGNTIKDIEERKKILFELEQRLKSEMPPLKRVYKYRFFKCDWEIGDAYAYKLESDLSKEKNFYGRYIIIRKVDEYVFYPGHIIPIVYVQMTEKKEMPLSEYDIINSDFVQNRKGRLGKMYQLKLVATTKRAIPYNKLKYLGNFKNLEINLEEYIPEDKISIKNCEWKNLENLLIDRYIHFTLNNLN